MSKPRFIFLLAVPALVLYAAQPWSKDSSQWTAADIQRLLADSPWSQPASASFADSDTSPEGPPLRVPGAAEAGMAGSRGVTDGRWDGGVGRNQRGGLPSLPVTVRWDSALPLRLALLRLQAGGEAGASSFSPAQAEKDYIISVIGLVPAGGYRSAGQLPSQSRSDDDGDSSKDPQDPERMLEGVMSTSRLLLPGRVAITPEDVKLDASTGTLHLFFPRNGNIDRRAKELTFVTRFGSMTIQKQFRLKDMIYKGKLEL